jgi:uncharacterized protein YbbC (DUF1343 family)
MSLCARAALLLPLLACATASDDAAAGGGPPTQALTGIDVLEQEDFALLRGARVGLLTNRTGRTRDGRRTIDALAAAPGVELVRLFTPEHGLDSIVEGKVGDSRDSATDLPIRSLYGDSRRPAAADLEDLDWVVFDVQDVGVRFYTYSTTLLYLLEACAESGVGVVVLDRPNPIGPYGAMGPISLPEHRSFICPDDMPVAHGLTLGEFARWQRARKELDLRLEVVPVQGWAPDQHWEETGLAWIPPSPNLRTPEAAVLYPGIGLLEATNLSVGRGTDEPFLRVGAPWLDGRALALRLRERSLPGLVVTPIEFVPDASKFAGETCGGIHLQVVDREAFHPVAAGLSLAEALVAVGGEAFEVSKVVERLAAPREEAGRAALDWSPGAPLDAWWQQVQPHLLYPR